MITNRLTNTLRPAIRAVGRALPVAVLLLTLSLAISPASRAAGIDPEADQVLKAMASYLQGLTAFSVASDIDSELINLEGQKLQLSSFSSTLLYRPSRLHVSRQGMFADMDLFYDGETLMLHGNRHNAYMQLPVPGTINDAIQTIEMETGIDFPAADLLLDNPYDILTEGVTSSHYIGTAYVDGTECHHLAFREDQVDWQLWVQVGETPLPMKYVVTTKWLTGAPQYSVRFSQWNTAPVIDASHFTFSPPADAIKLDSLPVNEMGELAAPEEEN